MNIKNLIELKVDTKSKICRLLLFLIFILFPLNQQYHLRPFPSVDGFIIDYLIVKISVVELLLISYYILNIREIYNSVLLSYRRLIFSVTLFLVISIFQSNYIWLAIYENFILFLFFTTGIYFYKNQSIYPKELLIKAIKFWLIFLLILGFAQFYYQESIFDNYPLTGEFPYTDDYYHIKQKNPFLGDLIPPYGIFSHSNIFGAYVIFLIVFLRNLGEKKLIYSFVVLVLLLLIGSSACFLAFILYLISCYLNKKPLLVLIKLFIIVSLILYFLFSYKFEIFQGDYSVYRRLYMFDLSSIQFLDSPQIFWFGSGYYNYFSVVKDDLYFYELVRFFQPPHFAWNFIIWQYGFLFLIFIFLLIYVKRNLMNKETLQIALLIVILFSFDHYLLTNHQIKFLLFLLIPYSLNPKNSVI
jgi:hypothetical protein